jgi:nucleotide-binding universal stress UspA family protein
MDKIKKILAPTDLSELSLGGVRYALEIAKSEGAEVIVYYVIVYPTLFHTDSSEVDSLLADEFLENGKRLLNSYLTYHFANLMRRVKVRHLAEPGVPHSAIVEKAEKERVDLIVMSTHGRTGLSHMLIGSVTERVVRKASCPVLSIHPKVEAKPTQIAA